MNHSFMKSIITIFFLFASGILASAAERTPDIATQIVPPTVEWSAKIAKLAPAKPRVTPKAQRKILMCSLATGYCHKVIPHVKVVIDQLASTGAFEVVHTDDVKLFDAESLKEFDAVILNNTCSKRPTRNLFIDALASDPSLSDEQRLSKAAELEKSLIDFVSNGKGLLAVHGGVVFLNNSDNFSEVLGASFVRHPKLQRITLTAVDPKHPLVQAFKGEPFIHTDEPYLFNKAYDKKNFRPLLELDVSKLDAKTQKAIGPERRYVSWIKKHGRGRVLYISPSHQPESYESGRMLQYYLDGIQYVLGDLICDDSVMKGLKQ